MKLVEIGPSRVFFRILRPRWSHRPLSGGGAARTGDRFNRPGVEVLYLAQEVETAVAEYAQDMSLPQPGTLVSYHVRLANVVDFSAGYEAKRWSDLWRDYDCDWEHIVEVEGRTPPCWWIADELIAAGRQGLLFPSTLRKGGTNLAVFMENLDDRAAIRVHDPEGDLPRNANSWKVEAGQGQGQGEGEGWGGISRSPGP